MKISIILNSKYEGMPIYLSLLVFQNECQDITSPRYPELIETAKKMVMCFDNSTRDLYKGYIFNEVELATAITALEYAVAKGAIVLDAEERGGALAGRLKRKYHSLRDGMDLL